MKPASSYCSRRHFFFVNFLVNVNMVISFGRIGTDLNSEVHAVDLPQSLWCLFFKTNIVHVDLTVLQSPNHQTGHPTYTQPTCLPADRCPRLPIVVREGERFTRLTGISPSSLPSKPGHLWAEVWQRNKPLTSVTETCAVLKLSPSIPNF